MAHQVKIQKRLLTVFTNKLEHIVSKLKEEGLENLAFDPNVSREVIKSDIVHLEESISAVESITSKVEKTLANLASLVDQCEKPDSKEQDDFETYYCRTETLLSGAIDYTILLQARLRTLSSHAQSTSTRPIAHIETPNTSAAQIASPQPRALELPHLPIPTFSGNVWEWGNFWELFNNNIHSQPLPVMFKYNYLLAALKGEARESIEKFQVTNDNYDKAIQFLSSKYGNKELLINALIERLDGCSLRGPSIRDQRSLLEQVQVIIEQLAEQGERMDSAWIIKKVLSKFPTRLMKKVIAKKQSQGGANSNLTMKTVIQYLDEIISTEEMCAMYAGKGPISQETKGSWSSQSFKMKGSPNLTSQHHSQNTNQRGGPSQCMFCKKAHPSAVCTKYATPQARSQYLRQNQLCLMCASSEHKTSESHAAIRKNIKDPPTTPQLKEKVVKQKGPQGIPTKEKAPAMVHSNQSVFEDTDLNGKVLQPAVVLNTHSSDRSFLPTGEATVLDPNSRELRKIDILFDSGAEVSFIESSLADQLDLPVLRKSQIRLQTFGSNEVRNTCCKLVRVEIWDNAGKPYSMELYTQEVLTRSYSPPSITEEDMKTIRSFTLPVCTHMGKENIKPSILLGCDYLWSLVCSDRAPITLPSGLTLLPTKLGYVLAGKPRSIPQVLQVSPEVSPEKAEIEQWESYWGMEAHVNTIALQEFEEKEDEKEKWEKYWAMDAAGTEEFLGTQRKEQETSNQKVWERFNKSIELRPDGYYVRLPWKDQYTPLPDNRALAYKRLINVWSSLKKNAELLDQYNDVFMDQLSKNIVEVVDEFNTTVGSTVHYIPHQPVLTPQKTTTKLRIVFDASAHYKGSPSLNDVLHRGPVILPPIYGLLLRFRIGKIALVADVEKAFLQIRLHEADRDATRCLWLRNHTDPPSPENIQIFRFTRVTFGLKPSPFLLAGTMHYHLSKCSEDPVAQEIKDNLYVDNLILTIDSEDEALQYYQKSKQLFNNLNMNLREFASNGSKVMESIPERDRISSADPKILGVAWRLEEDDLVTSCSLPELEVVTKRKVTSALAAVYDPLGWLVPLIHKSRTFLQSLWKDQYDWDSQLPGKKVEEWREIHRNTSGFYKTIPRSVTARATRGVIATFADASSSGMTACSYWYCIQEKSSTLLMAKAKLPSLHGTTTIPKLELNAFTLAMRISNSIISQLETVLNIEGVYILTDSEIVLAWQKSKPGKELGTFVNNRLTEIRRITEHLRRRHYYVRFGYIPSSSNPADCGTRGLTKEELADHYWWKGPELFGQGMQQWPLHGITFDAPTDNGESASAIESGNALPNSSGETRTLYSRRQEDPIKNNELIEKGHARTFAQAKRIMAYALRFIGSVVASINNRNSRKLELRVLKMTSSTQSHFLTADEITKAAILIIKHHQKERIDNRVIESLRYLNIHADSEGILRCYGRLGRAQLPAPAKQPILVLQKTSLAEMIIIEAHEKGHPGINHTVARVREEFWIPQLRAQVTRVLRKCVKCQKFNNLPYQYPIQQDLPKERVVRSRPFEHVGLDYFGPLSISLPTKIPGKCYGSIVTCMTTRLLHLDIVTDLTTAAFLNMLRRFFSRRGVPKSITSDNAPTFTLGGTIINESILAARQDPTIAKELSDRAIDWKHITPYAPWQGGFYERLIKSVKYSMYKTLGESIVSLDELSTVIIEIEGMLNTRPLTYISSDFDGLHILRPIDFLQRELEIRCPDIRTEDEHIDPSFMPPSELATLRTKQQAVAALEASYKYTEKFWKLWQTQYLTSLREKHTLSINNKRGCAQIPREGVVVLIMEAVLPRHNWKLGIIEKVVTNATGIVREAIVRLPFRRMIRRPINLLIPLELEDESTKTVATDTSSKEQEGHRKHQEPSLEQGSTTMRYNLRKRRKINYDESKPRSSGSFSSSLIQLLTIAALVNIFVATEAVKSEKPLSRSIQCFQGGAQLFSPERIPFEICAEDYCVEYNNPKEFERVSFPPAVIVHEHRVQWKFGHANSTETFEMYCPAAPFCPSVDCTLCSANILNPECWPVRAIIATAIVIYFLVTGCYVFLYIPLIIGWPIRELLRLLFKSIQWVLQHLKRLVSRRDRNSRPRRWNLAEIIAVWCAAVGCSAGCQMVNIFDHPTTICSGQEKMVCSLQHSEVFKINTFKQEACLRLSANETTMHELRLRWKSFALYCEPVTNFFTRDVIHRVVHSKRCPHSGSCVGEKCAAIKPSSIIPELEKGNHYPGSTACVESCGGPGCDCFYLSSGCLFYRIYLEPINTQIYEVFHYSRWKEEAKIEVTHYDAINKTTSTFISHLVPNIPVKLKIFTFTLTSITLPPLPLLSAHFLTDFTRTAIWRSSISPPLQCSSAENAHSLNCTVADQCQCFPAETKANCRCTDVPIRVWIGNIRNQLPAIYTSLSFHRHSRSRVQAKISSMVTSEIVATFQGEFMPKVLVDEAICSIKASELTGCYNCEKGAVTRARCIASRDNIQAEVTCDRTGYAIPCNTTGVVSILRFAFSQAKAFTKCSVACGTIKSTFEVSGILKFTASFQGMVEQWLAGNSVSKSEIQWPDFFHIGSVFWQWYKTLLATTIGVIILLLITYLFFTTCGVRLALWVLMLPPKFIWTVLRLILKRGRTTSTRPSHSKQN